MHNMKEKLSSVLKDKSQDFLQTVDAQLQQEDKDKVVEQVHDWFLGSFQRARNELQDISYRIPEYMPVKDILRDLENLRNKVMSL